MDSVQPFSLDNLIHSDSHDFVNIINQSVTPCIGNFTNSDEDETPYAESSFDFCYMDETAFCSQYKNNGKFLVMSLNIQCLNSKFNELRQLVSNMLYHNCAPDIICLQETWQIPNIELLSIPNYFPLECLVRHNNVQGGGVGMYFRETVQYRILKEQSVMFDKVYESIFAEVITSSKKKYLIGSIYRPGNHSNMTQSDQFNQFIELFANSLSDLTEIYERIYLFGDFNIDILKYSVSSQVAEYIDLLFSFGFLQVIAKPTRVTDFSATLIDHVLTNSYCKTYESVALSAHISDHFPILHFLAGPSASSLPKSIEYRDFSEDAINKFKDSIQRFNWTHVTDTECAQTAYNNFSATFSHLYNTYFPVLKKKFNKNFHKIEPWMTNGLLISRRQKILLGKAHLKNRTVINLQCFKDYRNVYNKVVRTAKKLYFEKKLASNQANIKKVWQILYSAVNIKRTKTSNIRDLIIDDQLVSDPLHIANFLNNYFANVASKIVSEIEPTDRPPDSKLPLSANVFSFCNNPVTFSEIKEACDQLQSKTSLDFEGISLYFVKKVICAIATPILHVFRQSLSSGIVPSQFKIAKVVPVFKSGDKTNPDNYRPISLLSSFSKILEKVVSIRLTHFLEKENVLTQFQFGFRTSHSTAHAMVHFLNNISKALNEKKHTIAIFCDLRKAFDTVNHAILLKKLFKMGIRGIELDWFRDYLSNRKQFVFLDGKSSALSDILIGDTTLSASGDDLQQLTDHINTEFQKVCEFFRSNRLSLHPAKTKFMIFTSNANVKKQNISIFCNNNNVNATQHPNLIFPLQQIGQNDD